MKTTFMARVGIGIATLSIVAACSAADIKPHAASDAPSPASKPAQRPPIKVRAQATLVAPYAAPTLKEFSRSWFVIAAVEGNVTDAVTEVRDEQDSVGTTLSISVERGWGVSGTTITATEYGGVVPLRAVRNSFEGKEWQKPLTEADLDRPVEYRMEGFPPTHAGDHVVLFLTRKEDGTFAIAAKLLGNGPAYGWAEGEAPNEAWAKEYSGAEIDDLLAAR